MLLDQAQAQLRAAAAPALERIRRDTELAPPRIQAILAYIRSCLFDPDLRVDRIKRVCGIRDNSISSQFRAAVGLPPYTYIEECRMLTATSLVRDTDLTVSQVGELVGYGSLQVFSTAFERWSSLRPSAWRKRARAGARPAPDASFFTSETLRRAILGGLEKEEARKLLEHLLAVYPAAAGGSTPPEEPWRSRPAPPPIEDEEAVAEATWQRLRELPSEEALLHLHRHRHLCTPALVHLLRRQSRVVGRTSRKRCIEVACLAQECVLGFESWWREDGRQSVKDLLQLKVQALVSVGNAYRLALRLAPAERAFAAAEAHLPVEPDRQVLAELLGYLGALRWYQCRYAEGIELESRAIELFRLLGQPVALAEALLTRGGLFSSQGEHEACLRDVHEGLPLLDEHEEPALMLGGTILLAESYDALGRLEQAHEYLVRAYKPAERLGKLAALAHLRHLF